MSENTEFALRLAREKAESDSARIDQLKRDLSIARNDTAYWMDRAEFFSGYVLHKCEECGREFAINEADDNGLEEPACPECTSTNATTIGPPR